MAAHVQTKDLQVTGATTCTVALTSVGASNQLVASTMAFNGASGTPAPLAPTSTPTATWSASVATKTIVNGTSTLQGRMDYSANVVSGSWSVVMNVTNGAGLITGFVSEISGSGTPVGASNGVGTLAAATAQPGSITPTTGSIAICSTVDGSGNTAAMTCSGFTVSSDLAGFSGANLRGGSAFLVTTSSASLNPTWTETSGTADWMVILGEFLLPGGIPPGLGPVVQMEQLFHLDASLMR